MKKLLALLLISMFLIGCNNGTYDKAMEQGKLALASGEFDKALASFELALDEKPKDEEAKASYEKLVAYNEVKKGIENAKWDEALTKANNLLKEENLVSSIKNQLEEYIKIAKSSKEQSEVISGKVEQIKKLVSEKKYSEAQIIISELKQDESIKDGITSFSKELSEIEHTVNEEIKKMVQSNSNVSKKKEYIQKLNNIQVGLGELEYLYVNGITSEMKQAESEIYKRWDTALNEIYGILKIQLSTTEMEKLKQEQREWIKYRDNTAKAESLEFQGGTMESLQYISTQGQITKERCYELVKNYMK